MDTTGRTILLVEDEVLIAMAEEKQLVTAGYNVITALSGEDAINIAVRGSRKIDLILMDIDLGRGIDGTKAAMEILRHKDIPVLFQSSHTEKDIIEKTEMITSYGYVVKHSGIAILDASIKMAFRLHKAYTELKEKEENLLIKERAIESSLNAVAISDPSANIIYVNPTFLKLWGYESPDEVLHLNATNLWVNNGQALLMLRQLLNQGKWRGEVVCRRKDGTVFDVETSAGIIYGQNNKAIGIITAFQDITERKLSEAKERESRESYRVLVENMDSLVCEVDSNGRYTYLSPAYKKVTGFDPEELLGKPVVELLHPDDIMKWNKKYSYSVKPDCSIRETWGFRIKNGEWRRFDCSVTFFEKKPADIRAVVISNDVTERFNEEMRTERVIRENELSLRALRDRVVSNSLIINSFIDTIMEKLADDASKQLLMLTESRIRFCISLYKKFHAMAESCGMNLYEYIRDIVESVIVISEDSRKNIIISSELESITLELKWMLPLGLILNELITNAVVHAYPASCNAEIKIGVETGAGRFNLCVSDNGVGFSCHDSSEQYAGLGITLAKKMAHEIGGELTFCSDSGTLCILSVAR